MSSLTRRIQRMQKRTSKGAAKRMFGRHFGDKVGVNSPPVAKNPVPFVLRRSKKEKNPRPV